MVINVIASLQRQTRTEKVVGVPLFALAAQFFDKSQYAATMAELWRSGTIVLVARYQQRRHDGRWSGGGDTDVVYSDAFLGFDYQAKGVGRDADGRIVPVTSPEAVVRLLGPRVYFATDTR